MSTADPARILRPGAITREQVAAVLEQPVSAVLTDGATPRVSGSLEAHYAPRTPTCLIATEDLADALKRHADKRVALLAFEGVHSAQLEEWGVELPKIKRRRGRRAEGAEPPLEGLVIDGDDP